MISGCRESFKGRSNFHRFYKSHQISFSDDANSSESSRFKASSPRTWTPCRRLYKNALSKTCVLSKNSIRFVQWGRRQGNHKTCWNNCYKGHNLDFEVIMLLHVFLVSFSVTSIYSLYMLLWFNWKVIWILCISCVKCTYIELVPDCGIPYSWVHFAESHIADFC